VRGVGFFGVWELLGGWNCSVWLVRGGVVPTDCLSEAGAMYGMWKEERIKSMYSIDFMNYINVFY